MKYLACFLSAVFCSSFSYAQSSKNDCLQEVKAVWQKFSAMGNAGVPKDKIYYFNYTVRTATKDSLANGISSTVVSMWASGSYVQIKSGDMEIYQNPDDAFVVLPKRKQLVRVDPYTQNEKDKKALDSRIQFVQDTLFSLSKVTKCETKSGKKIIVLEVNPESRTYLGAKRITFVINVKENEFESMKMECSEGNGILTGVVYIEYKFNEVSYDYKGKDLKENLENKFLKTSKTPTDAYKGYELVDSRRKKNKAMGKQWK